MIHADLESRLRPLLSELLESGLSAEDHARLDQLLTDSIEARRFYRQLLSLHTMLEWRFGQPSLDGAESPATAVGSDAMPRHSLRNWADSAYELLIQPTALGMLISGLFITTILLSLALWRVPEWRPAVLDDKPAVRLVAQITGTHQATWDKSSDGNFHNRDLFAGERLVLNSGLAEVTFDDGAVVLLEGPSELIVDTGNAASFQHGKLVGRVPPAAVGFTIDTPLMQIVDLGTEFGVEVDKNGQTVAEVLEGEVVVRLIGQVAQKSVTLKAGESAKVTPGNDKIQKNDTESEFVRKLPPKLTALPADWGTLIIDDDLEGSGDDSAIIGDISKPWNDWATLEPPYMHLLELAGDEDAAAGRSPKLATVDGLAPHSHGGRRPSVTYRHHTQPGIYVVRLQILNYSNAPFTGIEKVLLAGLAPIDAAQNPIPQPGDDEVWTYLYEVNKDSANRELSLEIQAPERDGSNWGADHVQIYFRPTDAD